MPRYFRTSPGKNDEDTEAFLSECGRFRAVTSPEVVMLLSTSLRSDAVLVSGGCGPEVISGFAGRSSKAAGATSQASSTSSGRPDHRQMPARPKRRHD
jgi:hypothetical protein